MRNERLLERKLRPWLERKIDAWSSGQTFREWGLGKKGSFKGCHKGSGLGFRVYGLGFRDWGFGVEGLGLIQGFGLWGARVWGFRAFFLKKRALRFRDSSFLEFGSFFSCLLFLGVLLVGP